jgi:hypothetical protein
MNLLIPDGIMKLDLNLDEKAILSVIYSKSGDDWCFIDNQELSEIIGCSVRNVQRKLRILEEKNYLSLKYDNHNCRFFKLLNLDLSCNNDDKLSADKLIMCDKLSVEGDKFAHDQQILNNKEKEEKYKKCMEIIEKIVSLHKNGKIHINMIYKLVYSLFLEINNMLELEKTVSNIKTVNIYSLIIDILITFFLDITNLYISNANFQKKYGSIKSKAGEPAKKIRDFFAARHFQEIFKACVDFRENVRQVHPFVPPASHAHKRMLDSTEKDESTDFMQKCGGKTSFSTRSIINNPLQSPPLRGTPLSPLYEISGGIPENSKLNSESKSEMAITSSRMADKAPESQKEYNFTSERKKPVKLNSRDVCEYSEKSEFQLKRSVFKKPMICDIKNYCDERKNSIDPEHFFDYYESKGWRVGNSPMKDWKACVRTWERNNFQSYSNSNASNFKFGSVERCIVNATAEDRKKFAGEMMDEMSYTIAE